MVDYNIETVSVEEAGKEEYRIRIRAIERRSLWDWVLRRRPDQYDIVFVSFTDIGTRHWFEEKTGAILRWCWPRGCPKSEFPTEELQFKDPNLASSIRWRLEMTAKKRDDERALRKNGGLSWSSSFAKKMSEIRAVLDQYKDRQKKFREKMESDLGRPLTDLEFVEAWKNSQDVSCATDDDKIVLEASDAVKEALTQLEDALSMVPDKKLENAKALCCLYLEEIDPDYQPDDEADQQN